VFDRNFAEVFCFKVSGFLRWVYSHREFRVPAQGNVKTLADQGAIQHHMTNSPAREPFKLRTLADQITHIMELMAKMTSVDLTVRALPRDEIAGKGRRWEVAWQKFFAYSPKRVAICGERWSEPSSCALPPVEARPRGNAPDNEPGREARPTALPADF
jgi:hypothetical protein